MTIEFTESAFQAIEDTLGQLREHLQSVSLAADLPTARVALREAVKDTGVLEKRLREGVPG